jgi:hypothetical protein
LVEKGGESRADGEESERVAARGEESKKEAVRAARVAGLGLKAPYIALGMRSSCRTEVDDDQAEPFLGP